MVDAHFKNIRCEILQELEKAKKTIQIAVYWFTNHDLFNKLKQKLDEGIIVELIIHNDYINNRDSGLPFQNLINSGGKFYFSDDNNPMHNKFCIVDSQVLINGSYNWTYYAESKNRENVLIIKEEKEVIEAFKVEFQQLIKLIEPVKSVSKLTRFEVEENNPLRNRDYLAHDIIYQAKATNHHELVKEAFEIAPKNLSVQRIANDLNLIKKYKLKNSIGVGIINDEVKLIAMKGAKIPAIFTTIVRTSSDYQTKSVTNIIYGESKMASLNSILTTMTLDGLPSKLAGKTEVKFSFSIDIKGNILIEKMSLDTGKKESFSKNTKELIEEV